MPSQTKTPETPSQEDSPITTGKETKLDRLANDSATRAVKRQHRYDKENNIFTE
jgi:hypothetical protein